MVALDEVDSTSDRAAHLVRSETVALPLCVCARRQTRGRGRGTHSWWSDSGSLTFTVAIDPLAHGLASESEPKLALAMAVAVIAALTELGFDSPALGIRWPNDLEADGRKLGGILPERIETEARASRPDRRRAQRARRTRRLCPAEVRRMATSLSASIVWSRGRASTAPRLLAAILDRFRSVLGRLVEGDPTLPREWNRLDLLRDEWVTVDLGPRIVAGRGCGIDADGALVLDDGAGHHRVFGGRVLR